MTHGLKVRPLNELVRTNIQQLKPYNSGRGGLIGQEAIFLDANERPDGRYNRYPDELQTGLKNKLASLKNVAVSQIFIGNGSDEIIDLLFRIFCRPGTDKAITFTPSFSMYRIIAQLNDVQLTALPLDEEFQPDPMQLHAFSDDETAKLLFLCSPNNPTGNSFHHLERLLQRFRGIVVMDEAYIDFSQQASFLDKLWQYPNLVILQTFSKARALAGARIGMAFASEEITRLLNAVRMPYNISALNQEAALASLDDPLFEQCILEIVRERDRVAGLLASCPVIEEVFPSDANFLLVRVTDADRLCDQLAQTGICVRNQNRLIPGCIRITIGAQAENDRLIEVLQQLSTQQQA